MAGRARDQRAMGQLSKHGVLQVVPDIQSPTVDDHISDRCQDVFVVLPIALDNPDNDAGVAISHTCGETVDTASARYCGILACRGLATQE